MRTRETADGLLASSPTPLPAPAFDARIYAAEIATLYEVLADTPTDCRAAALIGHNPSLSQLVRALLFDGGAKLGVIVPGALIALTTTATWKTLRPRSCQLARFEAPA